MLSRSLAFILLVASSSWSSDWTIRTRRHIDGSPYEDSIYAQYVSGAWRRWDSGFPNGKLSLTWITDCSNHRRIFLNHPYHTFRVVPAEVKVAAKVSKVFVSRDTGERRDAFGFRARHIIQTAKLNSDGASPGVKNRERTRDGWYSDLPFSIECSSTAGNDSKPGFAIEETVTDHMQGQLEQRIVDRVIDISEKALDPALFSIPHDYHDENSWREKVKEFFRGR